MFPLLLNYNNPFYTHNYLSHNHISNFNKYNQKENFEKSNNILNKESEKKEKQDFKEYAFSDKFKESKKDKINSKLNTNFSLFKYIDNILSIVDGEDLIIIGVLCLLYNNDDPDIFLIIVLLLLLFDI